MTLLLPATEQPLPPVNRPGADPQTEGDVQKVTLLVDDENGVRESTTRVLARVVCAVHLGLLRGLADRAGRTDAEVRLIPFIQPRLCQAELIDATAEHL